MAIRTHITYVLVFYASGLFCMNQQLSSLESKTNENLSQQELDEELLKAARDGNTSDISSLLAKGANIETGGNYTPLVVAVFNNKEENVKLLLQKGAKPNINTEDFSFTTPLHTAVYHGSVSIAKSLIDAGANIEARSRRFGETPLMTAADWQGSTACVRLLIDEGADIKAGSTLEFRKDFDADNESDICWTDMGEGLTALHFAARGGCKSSLVELLKARAPVDAMSTKGFTPLHCAVERGKTECAELLIDAHSPLDARSDKGYTPLIWAIIWSNHPLLRRARLDNTACIDLLLRRGANPTILDDEEKNSVEHALRLKRQDCVTLLRNNYPVFTQSIIDTKALDLLEKEFVVV